MTATPTPWAADPDWREGYSWNIHIVDAANPDMRICFMTSDGPAQANADLIVEAVNNYDRLRAELASARKALEPFAGIAIDIQNHRKGWANDHFASEWAGRYRLTYKSFAQALAALGQPKFDGPLSKD